MKSKKINKIDHMETDKLSDIYKYKYDIQIIIQKIEDDTNDRI